MIRTTLTAALGALLLVASAVRYPVPLTASLPSLAMSRNARPVAGGLPIRVGARVAPLRFTEPVTFNKSEMPPELSVSTGA